MNQAAAAARRRRRRVYFLFLRLAFTTLPSFFASLSATFRLAETCSKPQHTDVINNRALVAVPVENTELDGPRESVGGEGAAVGAQGERGWGGGEKESSRAQGTRCNAQQALHLLGELGGGRAAHLGQAVDDQVEVGHLRHRRDGCVSATTGSERCRLRLCALVLVAAKGGTAVSQPRSAASDAVSGCALVLVAAITHHFRQLLVLLPLLGGHGGEKVSGKRSHDMDRRPVRPNAWLSLRGCEGHTSLFFLTKTFRLFLTLAATAATATRRASSIPLRISCLAPHTASQRALCVSGSGHRKSSDHVRCVLWGRWRWRLQLRVPLGEWGGVLSPGIQSQDTSSYQTTRVVCRV